MELWQLRYFLAVADGLSFRAAAARLNVSQPPLSRAVGRLEEELGVALFDRGGRRIALTEAGRAFRVEATGLIAQAERAIGVARGLVPPGEAISIGFEGSSVYDVVPRAVGLLRASHPNLAVALTDMITPDQERAILDGRIDAGFLVPPVQAPGLVATEIWRDELVAVFPNGHMLAARDRLTLGELARENFVTGSRQDQCGLHIRILALCRSAGFVPLSVLDVNDMAMVLGFVAAGIGAALLPRSAAHARPDVAVVPLRPRVSASLAIAYRRAESSGAVQALVAAAISQGRSEHGAPDDDIPG